MKCRYLRPKYIDELNDIIEKQVKILKYKLDSNNNSVLRDVAITDFLVEILAETNKVTPFNYRLEMEDK
jgi:hypothetical protein